MNLTGSRWFPSKPLQDQQPQINHTCRPKRAYTVFYCGGQILIYPPGETLETFAGSPLNYCRTSNHRSTILVDQRGAYTDFYCGGGQILIYPPDETLETFAGSPPNYCRPSNHRSTILVDQRGAYTEFWCGEGTPLLLPIISSTPPPQKKRVSSTPYKNYMANKLYEIKFIDVNMS